MTNERELRYSAADLRECAFPPNAGRAVRARDVLLVEILDVEGDAELPDEYRSHPPAGCPRRVGLELVTPRSFDLGRGVMLGRLAKGEHDLVAAACEPRGHFFRAAPSLAVRYAFWRDVTEAAISDTGVVDIAEWDSGDLLFAAVSLSRYVRDNAASTDSAARLVDYKDGGHQVIPRKIYESSHTYRLPLIERDWLDDDDAAALRRLLEAYRRRETALPDRVRRAMWRAEYAAWTRWADHAIPLVVAAFESLFATRIEDLTRNFKRRLPMLAQMVEVDGVDAGFAERLYIARSEDVHGHAVNLVAGWSDEAVADFRLALGLLRRALRRLIENDTFAQHFVDKESVDRLFGYQVPPVFSAAPDA